MLFTLPCQLLFREIGGITGSNPLPFGEHGHKSLHILFEQAEKGFRLAGICGDAVDEGAAHNHPIGNGGHGPDMFGL